MKKIRIGIIGGAGFTAGELIRLLINHPHSNLVFVQSRSQAEKPVSSIHRDLSGLLELHFCNESNMDCDLLFLCGGHGAAKDFLETHSIPEQVAIIDLSQDFRLTATDNGFTYGLPEAFREAIQSARRIANPGCFATAIQLALLPLASAGHLTANIHISAITGSTGAGQAPLATTHFSWRDSNISLYKAFKHQHLAEIQQTLGQLQSDFDQKMFFLPFRGNFTRGILAAIYLDWQGDIQGANDLYQQYYRDKPFVKLVSYQSELKPVINTNQCHLHVSVENGQLLITSAIDNLLKGAAGQAVQNMNLLFGFDEQMGLNLKASAF